ncbi:hypothetical protein NHQ30_011362 [Ciborinia camelliae]|nr:hypothetical protein NHQ30_011362 [Ciborinia camelliae]
MAPRRGPQTTGGREWPSKAIQNKLSPNKREFRNGSANSKLDPNLSNISTDEPALIHVPVKRAPELRRKGLNETTGADNNSVDVDVESGDGVECEDNIIQTTS